MMKQQNAVLLWQTNAKKLKKPSALRELLFVPAVTWVTTTLKGMGYSMVALENDDIGAEAENLSLVTLTRLFQWLSERGEESVLLVAGDVPLTDPDEIKGADEFHRKNKRQVTLFSTEDKLVTGAGWYNAPLLLKLVRQCKEPLSLYQIYGRLQEQLVESSRYYVIPTSILPADSSYNRGRLTERAVEDIHKKHLYNDVDIPLKDGIMISPFVTIGEGTEILPGTILKGTTIIGKNCVIGPNSLLENTVVGDNTTMISVHAQDAEIGSGAVVGPMSRLRPNTVVEDGVKIGNFVEIKNSHIGKKTSVAHLTYIGDSDVGARCNIGCGAVTVNYDGKKKYRTTIGDDVFIGCNSNLIAPVTVENDSYIAAGTTVTKTVPSKALAIGRVPQENKEQWVSKRQSKE